MRKSVMFLMILVISCMCFGQKTIVVEDVKSLICWEPSSDSSATYLVYQKEFKNNPDLQVPWVFVGTTKDPAIMVKRDKTKNVVYGVSYILYGDTSIIHSSLDSTACLDSSLTCTGDCSKTGAWYVSYALKKLRRIKVSGE